MPLIENEPSLSFMVYYNPACILYAYPSGILLQTPYTKVLLTRWMLQPTIIRPTISYQADFDAVQAKIKETI